MVWGPISLVWSEKQLWSPLNISVHLDNLESVVGLVAMQFFFRAMHNYGNLEFSP